MAVIDILRGLGMRVMAPRGLNCCGLPASNMGDDPAAKRMAKQTIQTLERAKVRLHRLRQRQLRGDDGAGLHPPFP